jgi:putative two-component system response regulator
LTPSVRKGPRRKLLDVLNERIDDPVLREQFESETKTLSLEMLRATALIGMFLFPLFGSLDAIVFPRLLAKLWGLRLAEIAVCAVIFLSLNTRLVRERTADVGVFLMVFSCLDIVAMCWLTGGPTSIYYAGINLTILVVIFVMIIDVRRVLAACAIIEIAFILPLFVQPFDAAQRAAVVSNNYFLLATMFLAVVWTLLKNRTRLKDLEGRLRLAKANDELKRLDNLKTQFFSNVSHEVRTPLAAIIGPVQSLYLGDAGPVHPDQQRLLESIYRNSLKLMDLINQMLDFARLEAGRMPVRLKKTDLAARLRDTVAAFHEMAGRKGLRLEFRPSGDFPPFDMDEEKFERIVTNLVRNAVKFTDEGSILLTMEAGGGRIRIGVEDTGIGIPAEHLPFIFERFHQVDGTNTRRFEGTGIGLTLVKEYVELLRGTLSVRSESGRGTRFEIDFPDNLAELFPGALPDRRGPADGPPAAPALHARRKDDTAGITSSDLAWMDRSPVLPNAEPSSAAEAPPANDRVVVAEDNADLRSFIGTMLGRFGHQVVLAADGVEAWEEVRRELPDAVVSDIMMPRLDGYELLGRLKSTPQTMAVPVILITAKPGLEAKLKGIEGGADAYLAKPVNIRELDAHIRSLVAARRLHLSHVRLEEMEYRMKERHLSFERLRRTLDATVQAVTLIVEMRDPYTAGHQKRVAALARAIGEEMGLSADRLDGLQMAGYIHDIGKIGVPAEILSKPSKLTAIEFGMIKTHPQAGYDILKPIEFPWPIARMVLEHHERMDGTGYPNGLRAGDILIESRILALADVIEAISTHRPYRPALGVDAALAEVESGAGVLYDAEAAEASRRLFRDRGYILSE